jgi:hypothetical protein
VSNFTEVTGTYTLKDKIILFLLGAGVVCFGFVFPDSLSDHDKILHFSAHFGMSFLIASCFYAFCTVKMRVSKKISYLVLITATLMIGCMYKYLEIQELVGHYSFNIIMDRTGCLTSMSQNMSGLMASILVIEYFFPKTPVHSRSFIQANIFQASKITAAHS